MEESTAVMEQEEFTASGADNTPETTTVVELPNRHVKADIELFVQSLELQKEKRGVTTLLKWLDKYLMHERLADTLWQRAVSTAAFVNGVRSNTQLKGDHKRSLRYDAEQFYS